MSGISLAGHDSTKNKGGPTCIIGLGRDRSGIRALVYGFY